MILVLLWQGLEAAYDKPTGLVHCELLLQAGPNYNQVDHDLLDKTQKTFECGWGAIAIWAMPK